MVEALKSCNCFSIFTFHLAAMQKPSAFYVNNGLLYVFRLV
jgi:hypothetical protein